VLHEGMLYHHSLSPAILPSLRRNLAASPAALLLSLPSVRAQRLSFLSLQHIPLSRYTFLCTPFCCTLALLCIACCQTDMYLIACLCAIAYALYVQPPCYRQALLSATFSFCAPAPVCLCACISLHYLRLLGFAAPSRTPFLLYCSFSPSVTFSCVRFSGFMPSSLACSSLSEPRRVVLRDGHPAATCCCATHRAYTAADHYASRRNGVSGTFGGVVHRFLNISNGLAYAMPRRAVWHFRDSMTRMHFSV